MVSTWMGVATLLYTENWSTHGKSLLQKVLVNKDTWPSAKSMFSVWEHLSRLQENNSTIVVMSWWCNLDNGDMENHPAISIARHFFFLSQWHSYIRRPSLPGLVPILPPTVCWYGVVSIAVRWSGHAVCWSGHCMLELSLYAGCWVVTVRWSGHCTLELSLYAGVVTVRWSDHCTLEWSLYVGVITVRWSGHCTLEWSLYVGVVTVRWSGHCTLEWSLYAGVVTVRWVLSGHCTLEWSLYAGVVTVRWSGHCTLEWSLYAGVITVRWSDHCTLEWSLYVGVITVCWSCHCTLEWSLYAGVVTVRWSGHCTLGAEWSLYAGCCCCVVQFLSSVMYLIKHTQIGLIVVWIYLRYKLLTRVWFSEGEGSCAKSSGMWPIPKYFSKL